MRVALLVALMCLAACASEKLALAPPSGVDFTGHWKLDEADSDDPLRVVQSQTADTGPGASGTSGSSGGRRGPGAAVARAAVAGPPEEATVRESARRPRPGSGRSAKHCGGPVRSSRSSRWWGWSPSRPPEPAGCSNRWPMATCAAIENRPTTTVRRETGTCAPATKARRRSAVGTARLWLCSPERPTTTIRHSRSATAYRRMGSDSSRSWGSRVPAARDSRCRECGSGRNKKAGRSPAFKSPCLPWRLILARRRDRSFFLP
jgi:hypothetical protein